jgi:hypothetical protein
MVDLPALSNLLMNLGSSHAYLVQSISPRVFHYTDLEALRSIVTSQDLWLTDSRFSNDYEEMKYGLGVARGVINRRLRRSSTRATEKKLLQIVRDRLNATKEQGVYVCCFCLADNLLEQWRSYGANGTGVSLGLETRAFEFVAGADMPPGDFGLVYLWRVFYDPHQQRKIVEDCMDIVASQLGSADEKAELADTAIRFFIPTFKNQDFEAEQEARLVFSPAEACPVKPEFRVARSMLIPYYSLRALVAAAGRNEWRLPIESVRVGPSAFRDENRRGVELLLRREGFDTAEVEVSSTPYRG